MSRLPPLIGLPRLSRREAEFKPAPYLEMEESRKKLKECIQHVSCPFYYLLLAAHSFPEEVMANPQLALLAIEDPRAWHMMRFRCLRKMAERRMDAVIAFLSRAQMAYLADKMLDQVSVWMPGADRDSLSSLCIALDWEGRVRSLCNILNRVSYKVTSPITSFLSDEMAIARITWVTTQAELLAAGEGM